MDIQALYTVYMLTFVHNANNYNDKNDNYTLMVDW